MSDLLKHTIFDETDCISEQTMFDYIDKKLSAKECHVVEKHLLHCDLCADALEGLELLKNRDRIRLINEHISEPQQMLASSAVAAKEVKVVSFNYRVVFSIAASVLLLIGGVFLFQQLNKQQELAENKSVQETSPPPPPAPLESEPSIVATPDANMDEADGAVKETESPKAESAAASKESNDVVLQENKAVLSNLLTKDEKSSDGDEMRSNLNTRNIALGRGESQNQVMASPSKSVSDDMDEKAIAREQTEESTSKKKAKPSEEELINKESDYYKKDLPAAPGGSAAPVMVARDNADKISAKASKKEGKSGLFGGLSEASEKRREVNVKEDAAKTIAYEPKSVEAEDVASAQTLDLLIEDPSQPEYSGGQDSLTKYINDSFKYPENYTALGLSEKKIYVKFIVEKDGKIKNAKIVKGLNNALDKEALRIVNNMPKWKPAKRNGLSVEQEMNLPITLK